MRHKGVFMYYSNYSKIKLIDNCFNRVCIFPSDDNPQKKFLVINLCIKNKSHIKGTIDNVKLKNPLNPKNFIYPITLESLDFCPNAQKLISKVKPAYNFSASATYELIPISFIFEISEFITKNKKLVLYYETIGKRKNKRIKIKYNFIKASHSSFITN